MRVQLERIFKNCKSSSSSSFSHLRGVCVAAKKKNRHCEWCKSNRSNFHTIMSKFALQCKRFKRLLFLVICLTCPSWRLGRKHVLHSPGPPSVSKQLKQNGTNTNVTIITLAFMTLSTTERSL